MTQLSQRLARVQTVIMGWDNRDRRRRQGASVCVWCLHPGYRPWPDRVTLFTSSSVWLWFQSRCALLSGLHLRKTQQPCNHVAEAAAFIKQVVNGSEIKFGKVIVTSWIYALSQASSFHLLAVSSFLSNWSYWLKRRWPVTPSHPSSSLLHKAQPGPSQWPSDLMSPAPYLHRFYAFLHIELWLTPGRDEPWH